MNRFQDVLAQNNVEVKRGSIEVLQLNLGKLCNLACIHCHVEAGPTKTQENMSEGVAQAVIRFMDRASIKTVDLTGGAPELNPNFKPLVLEAKKRGIHVMDRCNLTVFFEPGMSALPQFLKDHEVEVIASLPCYFEENVDKQRGKGTFQQSLEALRLLNQLGYGTSGSSLRLSLVYNPVGAHLPPTQVSLEAQYKKHLWDHYGIVFSYLYCITNMPITRYAKYLRAQDEYNSYVMLLMRNFNPHTVNRLMCRNTLSVSWDGKLYDCDFNQALGMELRNGKALYIQDVTIEELQAKPIQTANHCFACTAGAGSSCQGVLD
jgi:radical SAM/Cys-rich protein